MYGCIFVATTLCTAVISHLLFTLATYTVGCFLLYVNIDFINVTFPGAF